MADPKPAPIDLPKENAADIVAAYERIKANPKDIEAADTVWQYENALSEGLVNPVELPKAEVPQSENLGAVGSFVRHFGKSATADLSTTLGAVPYEQERLGITRPEAAEVVAKQTETAAKEHPWASTAGTVAGYVSPGGLYSTIIKGATGLLGKIGARKAIATLGANTLAQAGTEAVSQGAKVSEGNKEVKKAVEDVLDNLAVGTGLNLALPVLGKGLAAASPYIKKGAGFAGKKALGAAGISEEVIETYAKYPKEVSAMIKAKMSDFLPQFADEFNSKVQKFVTGLNNRMDEIVEGVKKPQSIDSVMARAVSIRDEMSRLKTTDVKERAIKKISQQIDRMQKLGKGGKMSAKDLLETKRDFAKAAKAYYKEGGIGSDEYGKFMAQMAGEADAVLDKITPEIQQINDSLRSIIRGQEALGLGSVFKSEGQMDGLKADRILRSIGQDRKAGVLNEVALLDDLVGTDVVKASEFYRAAQSLGNPDILSAFRTGRANLIPQALPFPLRPLGYLLQSPAMARPYISGAKLAGKGLDALSSEGAVQTAIPGLYGKLREGK